MSGSALYELRKLAKYCIIINEHPGQPIEAECDRFIDSRAQEQSRRWVLQALLSQEEGGSIDR